MWLFIGVQMKLDGSMLSTLRMSNSVKRNIWPRAACLKSVYPRIQELYFTLITPSVPSPDISKEGRGNVVNVVLEDGEVL